MTIIFKGTDDERTALLEALDHNCQCELSFLGKRKTTCIVHHMLISDQRALDGLIDGRRRVAKLLSEEFILPK